MPLTEFEKKLYRIQEDPEQEEEKKNVFTRTLRAVEHAGLATSGALVKDIGDVLKELTPREAPIRKVVRKAQMFYDISTKQWEPKERGIPETIGGIVGGAAPGIARYTLWPLTSLLAPYSRGGIKETIRALAERGLQAGFYRATGMMPKTIRVPTLLAAGTAVAKLGGATTTEALAAGGAQAALGMVKQGQIKPSMTERLFFGQEGIKSATKYIPSPIRTAANATANIVNMAENRWVSFAQGKINKLYERLPIAAQRFLNPSASLGATAEEAYLSARYRARGKINVLQDTLSKITEAQNKLTPEEQIRGRQLWNGMTPDASDLSHPYLSVIAGAREALTDVGRASIARKFFSQAAFLAHEKDYLPNYYINRLIQNPAEDSAMFSWLLKTGGIKQTPKGYMRHRKSYTPEYQQLIMGKIGDEFYLGVDILNKEYTNVIHHDYMSELATNSQFVQRKISTADYPMPELERIVKDQRLMLNQKQITATQHQSQSIKEKLTQFKPQENFRKMKVKIDKQTATDIRDFLTESDLTIAEKLFSPKIVSRLKQMQQLTAKQEGLPTQPNIGLVQQAEQTLKGKPYVKPATLDKETVSAIHYLMARTSHWDVTIPATAQRMKRINFWLNQSLDKKGLEKLASKYNRRLMFLGKKETKITESPLEYFPNELEQLLFTNQTKLKGDIDPAIIATRQKLISEIESVLEGNTKLGTIFRLRSGRSLLNDFETAPDNVTWGAARAIPIRKEILNDIRTEQIPTEMAKRFPTLSAIHRYWKKAMTVWNIPNQVQNAMTNPNLLDLYGISYTKQFTLVPHVLDAVTNPKNPYYQQVKDWNLLGGTFGETEIKKMSANFLKIYKESGLLGKIEKLIPQPIKKGGKALSKEAIESYSNTEGMSKVLAYIYAREKLQLLPAQAAIYGHNSVFDYSLVPTIVAAARSHPLGLPFATFMYKSVPAVIKGFVLRPWKAAKYYLAYKAIIESTIDENNWTKKEYKRIHKLLPQYLDQPGVLPVPDRDEKGRMIFRNISPYFAWNPMYKVYTAIKDPDLKKAMIAIGILNTPVTQSIAALSTGVDPYTGYPLYSQNATEKEKLKAKLLYQYQLVVPPWITNRGFAGHLYSYLTGKPEKISKQVSSIQQAGGQLISFPSYSFTEGELRQRLVDQFHKQSGVILSKVESIKQNLDIDYDEKEERISNLYEGLEKIRSDFMSKMSNE